MGSSREMHDRIDAGHRGVPIRSGKVAERHE
jgi:hypothetical protein